jgi:nicotinamide mononucleotide transporter
MATLVDIAGRLLAGLRATSPAEAVAVLLGLAYVLLVVRRNRWCWVAGGASSLIIGVLSAQARLPMQAGLQLWYVAMAVYGWWHWSREESGVIRVWPWRQHLIGIAASLAVAALVARWLATETLAAWPLLDAATTVLSLLATWLVARQVLENWLYWIAIDAVLTFLFAAQGLAFTALLFAVYLVIAFAGYRAWNLQRQRQESV